jgi:multiple sugar transport system ATP-binding protein
MTMGDRIGVLNHGRLIQVGRPQEVYTNPVNTFVAAFVGSPAMNLFAGEVANGRLVVPGAFELPLDAVGRERIATRDGVPVTVGIRSEDIAVGAEGPAEARVHHVENHGVEKIVTLSAGHNLIKATVPAVAQVKIDDTVRFSLNQDKLHGFDPASGNNRAWKAA